jgi:uncharacterized protein YndB with AHSA1/START domain
MAQYSFVDRWVIRAPINQVFARVADAATYPEWWPVYPKVESLPGPKAPQVGSRAKLTVKSALGYRLNLLVEIAESDPPDRLVTVARGSLEGTGTWQFEQSGDTTTATWTWVVQTHHPLLNLLEPIAKKLFEWSHNDASRKGDQGLRRLLEKRSERRP